MAMSSQPSVPAAPTRADDAQGGPSRRGFVAAVTTATVLAGFARRAHSATGQSLPPQSPLRRVPAGELRFLVDRITNGWTPAVWARANELGYAAFLEEQLAPASIPEDAFVTATLGAMTTLNLSSKQIFDTYFSAGATLPASVPVTELRTAAIVRGAFSTRQLQERMVEFWVDHFNTDHNDGQVRWLKTSEDRDVLRAHALGNFGDLLLADARSASMLYYLDNYRNFASAPNENYARELMELHTLGVGNFTETDVREVARCLTGWQYTNQAQPNHGTFVFNNAQHDNGAKVVLGQAFPAGGGVNDGENVLALLATHPATAQFVSRKLVRWFLSPTPPQEVVDRVANVFLATQGDIKSVLRAIFDPATVILVPGASLPKLKRPFHYLASALRATNPTITQPTRFVNELTLMGQTPLSWPAPNGYPDETGYWGSSVLPRWTFATRFLNGTIAGTSVAVATLFSGVPKSQLAARANEIVAGGALDVEDVLAIQSYANAASTLNDTLRRDVLALAIQCPSYQFV